MNALTSEKHELDGIRAAIVERCKEAQQKISGRAISAENVHAARKALKRARAWLRLLKSGLSAKTYRDQNRALRDAARPLSEGRDAQVLIETLDELAERYHEPAADRRFGRFKRALQRERKATQHRLMRSRGGIASSRRLVRRSVQNLVRLRIRGKDWDVIGTSFKKVYAHGTKSLRAARSDPAPECLHEWRKDAKYLWHELQMLEPLWPGVIGEWADQAHRLADYLGDDHDLWVLREAAKSKSETFRETADLDALLALIDRRRKQLQEKALLLGARLYEPKPKRLHARLRKYWQLWVDAGRPD